MEKQNLQQGPQKPDEISSASKLLSIEFIIVIFLVIMGLVALNYFNILSLSRMFPEYLGFLPSISSEKDREIGPYILVNSPEEAFLLQEREGKYQELIQAENDLKSRLENISINTTLAYGIREKDRYFVGMKGASIEYPDFSNMYDREELTNAVKVKIIRYYEWALEEQDDPTKDMADVISNFIDVARLLSYYCTLSEFDQTQKPEWSSNITSIKDITMNLAYLTPQEKQGEMVRFLENTFNLEELRTCF